MGNSLFFFLTLCFFLLLNSGGTLKLAHGQTDGQEAWCVAKPSSSEQELRANINYACGVVNCSGVLGQGSPCLSPETLVNRASVAMNLYYQEAGRNSWNCNFKNSGIVTVTDPSYGDCTYVYKK